MTNNSTSPSEFVKAGEYLYWQGQVYRVLPYDPAKPLTLQVMHLDTGRQRSITVKELYTAHDSQPLDPVFAATREALRVKVRDACPF